MIGRCQSGNTYCDNSTTLRVLCHPLFTDSEPLIAYNVATKDSLPNRRSVLCKSKFHETPRT